MDLMHSQPSGGLKLLDLVARLHFRTASSVSFQLGRVGPWTVPMKDGPPRPEPVVLKNVFRPVGWVDVHYPCTDGAKVCLRFGLPAEYRRRLGGQVTRYMVLRVLQWLDIPTGEEYEAHFHVGGDGVVVLENATRGPIRWTVSR